MLTSRARRLAAGSLMIAGLALIAAPLSASAHTGKLFTFAEQYVDDTTVVTGFAEFSQTTAAMTFLGSPSDAQLYSSGADVCTSEEAWGVGYIARQPVIYTWNHDSGVVGAPSSPTVTNPDYFSEATSVTVNQLWSADSLPDCTKLAYAAVQVSYEEGDDDFYRTISYVDPATGGVTVIMTLPEEGGNAEPLRWHGIATDPLSGATYLFFSVGQDPAFVQLFLDLPDLGPGLLMTGLVSFFEDDGAVAEADYQPDGTLWMTYEVGFDEGNDYRLITFAPNADLPVDEPNVVGPINLGPEGVYSIYPEVVTYDPYKLPATGGAPLGLLLVGGLLVLGGVAVTVMRRTSDA